MEYFNELHESKIFCDNNEFECQAMMFCFKTKVKIFEKNQPIVSEGDSMDNIVLLLKGKAIVESMDSSGDISVLRKMKAGEVYGVESAYAGEDFYKDSIIAKEKCVVMFLNKFRVLSPCTNRCKRHDLVVKNLMRSVAENNIELQEKMLHMSKRSTRDKLLSYFNSLSKKANSQYFELPFNKTELANYLSVDRSAMSTELSKMRDEGIIDFEKRAFRLIRCD